MWNRLKIWWKVSPQQLMPYNYCTHYEMYTSQSYNLLLNYISRDSWLMLIIPLTIKLMLPIIPFLFLTPKINYLLLHYYYASIKFWIQAQSLLHFVPKDCWKCLHFGTFFFCCLEGLGGGELVVGREFCISKLVFNFTIEQLQH